MAKLPSFQTTPESKKIIDDYYLATKAQEKLFDGFPSAEIKCKNAVVLARQPDTKHWVRRSMIKNASFREILSKKGVIEAIGDHDTHFIYAFADSNRVLRRNLILLGIVTLVAMLAACFGGDLFIMCQVKAMAQASRQLETG